MKSEIPILLQTLVLSINHWWYAQTFLIFEPSFHWFKIWACYYLLKSRLYLKFDFLHPFSCSNVCLQAYAYINNLYLIIYYRTIKYVSEKIFKKFCYMKLNVKDYTAVSVSVILPLSKMQQKPSKAAKAPYIQLSYLRGLIWRSDICFFENTIFKCNYKEKHLFVPLKFIKKLHLPQ